MGINEFNIFDKNIAICNKATQLCTLVWQVFLNLEYTSQIDPPGDRLPQKAAHASLAVGK